MAAKTSNGAAAKGRGAKSAALTGAELDAMFGRYMFRLGRMVSDAYALSSSREFSPLDEPTGGISSTILQFLDAIVADYEPLLRDYAAMRENAGGEAAAG